ncbi:MAG: RDD family protein [Oceanospirillaceae bacterium]|nr:RDD family protein [Oceanospirillaceae bacterium]
MDFLPLEINNKKVYAGFWKRFGAGVVDMLVMLPFMYLTYLLEGLSLVVAMGAVVISSSLYSAYSLFFHYKYGATLGKMATGIKVTLPDGKRIGIREALLRSSVDICFAVLLLTAQMTALSIADFPMLSTLGFTERSEYLLSIYPSWYAKVDIASLVWVFSELFVLLLNKRKRALHDFIAGTVVINKDYSS